MKKKSTFKKRLSPYEAYIWMLPAIVLMAVFILLPVIGTIVMSFSDVSQAGLVKGFAGFQNYSRVFKEAVFGRVMWNTVIWDVVIVSISMIISITLALVLNERFHGRKIFRTVLLLPWATSALIIASAWKYIFNYDYGYLNALLMKIGLIDHNINWLGSINSAFASVMFVGIYVTVPFMTFTLLAGLQSISPDYYEAAEIDGANFWDKLFRITLPLLKPAINVSLVLNVIYVFNSFIYVQTITGGAPAQQTSTIMTYLYYLAFKKYDFGASAAISVIGFIVLLLFAIIYMQTQMKAKENN